MKKQIYAGIFFVALATLMFEILLTRIFSVTMWFHFAFVAISIAMFGMTLGAILVYLLPSFFTEKEAPRHLAMSTLFFALTLVAGFLAHLYIPFVTKPSLKNLFFIGATYASISVPFISSGVAVCLALTKYPQFVGRLYAADLAGAALGCLGVVAALTVMDAPSAVFLTAALAALAAACFARGGAGGKLRAASLIIALFLAGFAAFHALRVAQGQPLFKLLWIKGAKHTQAPLYLKWNSFSRITVEPDPNGEAPYGWGLSASYRRQTAPEERMLKIDEGAATPITRFDGDLSKLEHLKHDVTNMAHYLRPNADVLVIGTGGGRDLLSALVFDQRSVLGIEINEAILDALNKKFGDFSGHLDRHPKIRFINDEARSVIARSKEKFDLIQVSLIDTSAATAAGAFVFTENSLYTVEAWKLFLAHLKPGGIVSFSRWYYLDLSGEIYRLTAVARQALEESGITDPRRHILVVKNVTGNPDSAELGTLLVSRDPFTEKDITILEERCAKLDFEIMISPRRSRDEYLTAIAGGANFKEFLKKFPINISPTTDDNPFYFSMLRAKDFMNRNLWSYKLVTFNMKAVFVLGGLLMIVSGLTFFCILIPLAITARNGVLKGSAATFAFFTAIGLGFMFVEISQMQRLIIFLGHPVYGLTAVLFTLLLSCSLGSYHTKRIGEAKVVASGKRRLAVLLAVLAAFGFFTPQITSAFQGGSTPFRILAAAGILFPLGFFMGMAFPLGIKMIPTRLRHLMPWLWGVNGAASVMASVLAAVIALNCGIAASFWTGFWCYVIAGASWIWASLKPPAAS